MHNDPCNLINTQLQELHHLLEYFVRNMSFQCCSQPTYLYMAEVVLYRSCKFAALVRGDSNLAGRATLKCFYGFPVLRFEPGSSNKKALSSPPWP